MIRTKEKISDVVQDCLSLSDGTIATLTGYRRKEENKMATKRGIEEIRQWVRTNLKDGDIRFMAEKWYDHMAGSNKFEATHDVYALYKEFEDIIWDKIREDARRVGEEFMEFLAEALEPFIVYDEKSMKKAMALYVIGVAIFGVAIQKGLID